MNNSKALTLLGFASKAGKLSFGADAALKSLKEKKAKLIVAACDVSEKSCRPQVRNTFGKRQRFCRRSFKGVR